MMDEYGHSEFESAKLVLAEICLAHSHSLTYSEAKEALETLESESGDFIFELEGEEFRLIHEDEIEDTFASEVRSTIEDCYDIENLIDRDKIGFLADHIEIDWPGVVDACLQDGYGHQFSHYDGSEYSAGGYYIFRTN